MINTFLENSKSITRSSTGEKPNKTHCKTDNEVKRCSEEWGGTNWKAQVYDWDGWKAGCMIDNPRCLIPPSPPKKIGF